MHVHDKILNYISVSGPTLPTRVAKNIKTDILIASAHLSDLSSQGKIRISDLKIGGSPLYYIPGQEDLLYKFIAGNVNPKDLQVIDKLKEKKVLREVNLDLLAKVALRSMKDFAVPLHVHTDEKKEMFWKWHLLSEEETNGIIASMLGFKAEPQPEEVTPKVVVQEKLVLEEKKLDEVEEPLEKDVDIEEQEKAETQVEEEKEEIVEQEQILVEEEKESVMEKEEPQRKVKLEKEQEEDQKSVKESKKVTPKEVTETPKEMVKEEDTLEEQVSKEAEEEELTTKIKKEEQKKLGPEDKKPLLRRLKDKITRKKRIVAPDRFLPVIKSYLKEMNIEIEQIETIRKNSELNFMVKVSSVVGTMTYFCKAKSKSRCDEKDISAAYMEAQIKKLPLLFLYTKEINKKAQEMLDTGAFENAIVKKIK